MADVIYSSKLATATQTASATQAALFHHHAYQNHTLHPRAQRPSTIWQPCALSPPIRPTRCGGGA